MMRACQEGGGPGAGAAAGRGRDGPGGAVRTGSVMGGVARCTHRAAGARVARWARLQCPAFAIRIRHRESDAFPLAPWAAERHRGLKEVKFGMQTGSFRERCRVVRFTSAGSGNGRRGPACEDAIPDAMQISRGRGP